MPEVTREEMNGLRDDMTEVKEICLKTYRKLFETNGGPSVLDRLSRVEDAQKASMEDRLSRAEEARKASAESRKWRFGIYATVIGCLVVQAVCTVAPLIVKLVATP